MCVSAIYTACFLWFFEFTTKTTVWLWISSSEQSFGFIRVQYIYLSLTLLVATTATINSQFCCHFSFSFVYSMFISLLCLPENWLISACLVLLFVANTQKSISVREEPKKRISNHRQMDFDLEKLYSPSQWSKRFSKPEDVENDHITFAENGKLIDVSILLYSSLSLSRSSYSFSVFVANTTMSIFQQFCFSKPKHNNNNDILFVYCAFKQKAFGWEKNGLLKQLNLMHENRMRISMCMAFICRRVSYISIYIVRC